MSLARDENDIAAVFAEAIERCCDGVSFDTLAVAVSGGSDSLALMLLAQAWSLQSGKALKVLTVDHGMRAESGAEARFVRDIARRNGLDHQILQWTTPRPQGNLQKAARDARYHLLAQARGEARVILTGHTLEDQAETVLMRLARGSGVDGLTGILERRWCPEGSAGQGYWIMRPLLNIKREALRDYLRGQGQTWVDDPSNDNTDFERIRLRKSMPLLSELGLTSEALAQTGKRMAQVRASLEQRVLAICRDAVVVDCGDLIIEHAIFARYDREIQCRVLEHCLGWVSSADYMPRSNVLSAALNTILEEKGTTLHGCLISVSKGKIRMCREYQSIADIVMSCERGQSRTWDHRWFFSFKKNQEKSCGSMHIRALGHDGARQLRQLSDTNLPFQSLKSIPGCFCDTQLVAVPYFMENSEIDIKFCTKPSWQRQPPIEAF